MSEWAEAEQEAGARDPAATTGKIKAQFQPVMNAALWHNSVPMLTELSFTNIGEAPFGQITIDLESQPPLFHPRSWRLQQVEPGQLRFFTDLAVQLDGVALGRSTEASRCTVTLIARSENAVVGRFQQEVNVLAPNEWGGARVVPDILAAFVQPNQPAVAQILRQASDLLRAANQVDSLEGYQGNKQRVWAQAQAVWSAVCGLDVRYINPPASFISDGQRIRSVQQIVSERLATCLDTALLFASCLEAIGLRPLIVLQKGHAFTGLWLSKGDFGVSTVDDAPGIRTRLKLDDLKLFETTLVTHKRKLTFQAACDQGADHLVPEADDTFEAVIDIHRARQRRILPLPSETVGYGFRETETDADIEASVPILEAAPHLREDPAAAEEPAALTPESRLQRWRNRLLDLSGRNRLLNLPKSDKQLVAIDCPNPAELENMLANMRGGGRGAPIRFRAWPDLMDGADPRSASLHRSRLNEDAGLAFAREALAKRELMVGRGDAAIQTALTEIYRKSRADEQEGGSNTLFLTIGSLWWKAENRDKPYQAPLILVPVVLERPSARSGFLLRPHSDESRLNATLIEMLKQEFSIRFSEFEGDRLPEDESGLDVSRILDIFRAKLRDVPGWEVQDSVALTNLSFTKFLMWQDLQERGPLLHESVIVRRLMNGPADVPAPATDSAGNGPTARHLDEMLAAADLTCPMEADSSQLQAVARAAAGESFVLIGPPGTGKSQTITNIIANTLAQGRTVLFVAEKRAALEVVQRRLRQIGLAEFCLDLFSSKASKMAVLEQLDRAQLAHEALGEGVWQAAKRDIAVLRGELNDYVRELHRRARNGWTPFRAIGLVLRAEAAAIPEVPLSWRSPDQHDAGDWQRLIEATEELTATIDRIGDVARAPVLVGIEQPSWSPIWQSDLLAAANTAARRLEALTRDTQAVTGMLGLPNGTACRTTLEHLAALAQLLLKPQALEAGWAVSEQSEQTRAALDAERVRIARHNALWSDLAGSWRPGVLVLPLGEIQAEWRGASAKWALLRTLGLRAVRRRLAAEAEREVPEDCGPDLDRLVELQDIAHALAAAPLAEAIGRQWQGLTTDFTRLEDGYQWARALQAASTACAADPASLIVLRGRLRQMLIETPDLLMPTGAIGVGLHRFLEACAATTAALDALGSLCGHDVAALVEPDRADWTTALAGHLAGWSNAAPMIRDWCSWCSVIHMAKDLGLGPLVQAAEGGLIASANLLQVFEANYARWWIRHAVDLSPRLRSFVAAQHETRIERFRALDSRMLGLAGQLIRARIVSAIPGAAQRQHDPEFTILTRELAKRQRHLPVRQLAQKMPTALRRLAPCLMMSPLSVAQYLPADTAQFDLVIFDEASQIPTWDAIGAVGRGRQVIIVGDPKQLPPTSFFERSSDGEGGVEVETQDLDSILDECLGAGIPSIELHWHYRSRHESLIAFSNQIYYGGRLITFPSPVTSDTAVSFRFVPDGIYGRAADRTNPAEARALVAEAVTILRRSPAPSLGIVTFNAEQQRLIEDLLDKARRDDPSLEPFFSDSAGEPVLLKNLEGVQGEERDVMLFSLTYGPDQVGKIGLNFGPLNLSGGERRLNVAVTRAREELVVFGSLRPEQIDLKRTNAIGVTHLKQFLVFAEQGARAFAGMASPSLGDFESPFEAAVAQRLRDKGWNVQSQIGVSGFRVDLGVVDPDAQGSFLAGIECDGATYHGGATARDRDRLRQVVLEGLGWHILRIWSTDWWTNAAREADRVHHALQMALTKARRKRAERAEREAAIATATAAAAIADAEAEALSASQEFTAGEHTEDSGSTPDVIDPDTFYLDTYRPRLTELLRRVVMEAGPIRDDRLFQRIARQHGFGRVGREIRDRLLSLLPGDCVRTEEAVGSFVWPPGIVPETWDTFRRPALGATLDPAELPLQELVALAASLRSPGMSDDQLLVSMRNACGMARMGEPTKVRFMDALGVSRS